MNNLKENLAFRQLFREYDIRGRVREGEFDAAALQAITNAFVHFLHNRQITNVVVGYDNRKISPQYAETAADILVNKGFKVYFIGLTITPAAYFAQYHLKAKGLMMITASHNPDGWCGCKLGYDYSTTLGSEDIKELYDLALVNEGLPDKQGSYLHTDIRDAYINDILGRVKIDNPKKQLRLVVDAGNGAAGIFAWELFQRLGCLVFQLNCDPDDNYPHYFPNPSDLRARERLAEMVIHPAIKADLGIAFDGDGDRIGVVDAQGQNIWSDRLIMLLAKAILADKPKGKVVYDVKCSQALEEAIWAMGGIPVMWKTGHSYIKEKMRCEKAVLAGERSGHIFIGHGGYGYDDALLAAALLCKAVAEDGRDLTAILKDYPEYITSPEIKIPCADDEKYEAVARLTQNFIELYGNKRVNTINGARGQYPEYGGWSLVRASSNLPELVLIFEADNLEGLEKIKADMKKQLLDLQLLANWENDN